jgi:hypothetical protein
MSGDRPQYFERGEWLIKIIIIPLPLLNHLSLAFSPRARSRKSGKCGESRGNQGGSR